MPRFAIEFNVDDVIKKAKSAGRSAREAARAATLELLKAIRDEAGKAVKALEHAGKPKAGTDTQRPREIFDAGFSAAARKRDKKPNGRKR